MEKQRNWKRRKSRLAEMKNRPEARYLKPNQLATNMILTNK